MHLKAKIENSKKIDNKKTNKLNKQFFLLLKM